MRLSVPADIFLNVLTPLLMGLLCYACGGAFLLRGHAADFLWAYSLLSMLLIVWERKVSLPWTLAALMLAGSYEWAQWRGLLPGTADWWDMATYGAGFAAAFFTNRFIIIPNKTQ